MVDDDPLCSLVMDHSPEAFWKELVSRQTALYKEAHSYSYHGALWEKPEAETVFPLVRRAMFESTFRSAAKLSGLQTFDLRHESDYPYVLVKTKKLIMTAHHVEAPGWFVRLAASRKQNAAVNKHLDYYVRSELLLQPLPDLKKCGRVNLYVLHGQQWDDEDEKIFTPFLQVAIPDVDLTKYSRVYEVRELLQFYAQKAVTPQPEVRVADRAIPRIKKANA